MYECVGSVAPKGLLTHLFTIILINNNIDVNIDIVINRSTNDNNFICNPKCFPKTQSDKTNSRSK